MTIEQYQRTKTYLENICKFPFPESLYAMQKSYGPKNFRRLAEISNNSEVFDIFIRQAEVEEIKLYRMGHDTPPLHFSLRMIYDFNSVTNFVLLESLTNGIDSKIFSGTNMFVRGTGQKQRIFLSGINSSGDWCEVSSYLNSPKLMTKEDYDILKNNRNILPFFLSKNGQSYIASSTVEKKITNKTLDVSDKIDHKNSSTAPCPIYKKGYYFTGGLEWSLAPIFVSGKVIQESKNNRLYLIQLEKTFSKRKDGIINVRSDSRRWVPEHIMQKLKNDKDFLESWISYQDKISELMVYHDRALLIEIFSKKDFILALDMEISVT